MEQADELIAARLRELDAPRLRHESARVTVNHAGVEEAVAVVGPVVARHARIARVEQPHVERDLGQAAGGVGLWADLLDRRQVRLWAEGYGVLLARLLGHLEA